MSTSPTGQLTVVRIVVSTKPITFFRSRLAPYSQRLKISEEIVGGATTTAGRRFLYPTSVQTVRIYYDDRRYCVEQRLGSWDIAETAIPYTRMCGGKAVTRQWMMAEKEIGDRTLTFVTACALTPDEILATDTEMPFHYEGRGEGKVLTNAPTQPTMSLPVERPVGNDWKKWPLIAYFSFIQEHNWPALLYALVGRLYSEIEGWKYHPPTIFEIEQFRKAYELKLAGEDNCQEIAKVFPESAFAVEVVGSQLLYSITQDNKSIYMVDSPHSGGLYIFESCGRACRWATREMDWSSAKLCALVFRRHTKQWLELASEAIQAGWDKLNQPAQKS